jgi:hypothetical protein
MSVTHNGSSVPYIGIHVFYGAPSAESYLPIPAGGSEEAQIDVSENYAIRQAGDYEVSFRLAVLGAVDDGDAKPPQTSDRLKLALIESKKVTFRIVGSGSTVPIAKPDIAEPEIVDIRTADEVYPLEPMKPTFREFDNEDEKADYYWAHWNAYQKFLTSHKRLQTGPIEHDKFYNDWFGDGPPDEKNRRTRVPYTLAQTLKRMATKSTTLVKTQAGSCSGADFAVAAWTTNTEFATIHLCHRAFTEGFLSACGPAWSGEAQLLDWVRTFIVMHEIAHMGGANQDLSYLFDQCKDFAKRRPDLAEVNAQNWALFAAMGAVHAAPPYLTNEEMRKKTGLKAGDTIYLADPSNKYLSTYSDYDNQNYIKASNYQNSKEFQFQIFFYDNPNYPFSILLRAWDGRYLYSAAPGEDAIKCDASSPDERCGFNVASVISLSGEYFIFQSRSDGRFWYQTSDLVRESPVVGRGCLFTIKLNPPPTEPIANSVANGTYRAAERPKPWLEAERPLWVASRPSNRVPSV